MASVVIRRTEKNPLCSLFKLSTTQAQREGKDLWVCYWITTQKGRIVAWATADSESGAIAALLSKVPTYNAAVELAHKQLLF